MKKCLGRAFLFASALAVVNPCHSSAQEFFRYFGTSRSSSGFGPVVPSEYTYYDQGPSGVRPLLADPELTIEERYEQEDRYNFALGPFRFGLAAGLGLEFNDNIKLSDEDRISDFILRPVVALEGRWNLSELNTLRLSIGASYAKYFEHSEFDSDGILLSPNSELSLTFYLGTVRFTVRDRFSYQEDSYDLPVLSNTAVYRRYENQAGIQADWGINQALTLTAGYDHYNLWAVDNEFEEQDRSIDTVFVKPSLQLSPTIKVGVSVAASHIDFSSDDRADGQSLLAGPFIEWQVTPYTTLYLEAGYQALHFDGGSDFNNAAIEELDLDSEDERAVREILRDTDDSDSYYVKFELSNRPSEIFSQRFSASKTAEIGFGSNFYDLYHVEYAAEYKLSEKTEIGPVLFYEFYETSGDFSEEAHRWGAALGIRHHLTNSITLGLDYRFIYKDSNLDDADYYQNLGLLSVYYKF